MMKKINFFIITTIILFVVVAFTTQVKSTEKSNNSYTRTDSLPDSVKILFEKSCYACHSNSSSNGFARKVLNFEKWDTYKAADQESYKGKICDKITNDKMPPSGYINKNPEAKLTEKHKKTICNWAKPLNK
jgi:hypothetical protein